jgi:hypothetical protein
MPAVVRKSWLVAVGSVPLLLSPAWSADAGKSPAVKIAVFEFELEDVSPAAAYTHQSTSSASSIEQVSSAARAELAKSGRYILVDTTKADDKSVIDRTLRDCDGCEADIARKLGAEQSMIGVVKRATQTDYYLFVQIRDARTGKVLDQESANFAGDETGWPTGARMLLKHQVLVTPN